MAQEPSHKPPHFAVGVVIKGIEESSALVQLPQQRLLALPKRLLKPFRLPLDPHDRPFVAIRLRFVFAGFLVVAPAPGRLGFGLAVVEVAVHPVQKQGRALHHTGDPPQTCLVRSKPLLNTSPVLVLDTQFAEEGSNFCCEDAGGWQRGLHVGSAWRSLHHWLRSERCG